MVSVNNSSKERPGSMIPGFLLNNVKVPLECNSSQSESSYVCSPKRDSY